MARRSTKSSGNLTFTAADRADMSLLIETYISTGRLKVTRCPDAYEDRSLTLQRRRAGGVVPNHLDPRRMVGDMGDTCHA